ncbi:MAG: helix-turn-helix domain-containing protein [Candidatus Fimenecus sp.]
MNESGLILRKLRGNTPRNIVAKAVGISISALGMYEQGRRVPRDEIKVKLSNFYKVPVWKIFFTHNTHLKCD